MSYTGQKVIVILGSEKVEALQTAAGRLDIKIGAVPLDGIITAPAKVVIEAFDDLDGVAAILDAANIALNTDHRGSGTESVEWDKLGTNILSGVQATLPAALDLSLYSVHSQVMWFGYIPTPAAGNVTSVYVALGTDLGNNFYWQIPAAELHLDEWWHYHHRMSQVDGVAGVGADLSNITWAAIVIVTDAVGCTFANARVDQILVKRSWATVIGGEMDSFGQTTPADGLTPLNALEIAGFPHVYDPVAGDWNRWIQSTTEGVPLVQDTGVNTSPEKWLQDNHWEAEEIEINAAGVGGQQNLGAVVPAGETRRIRELTIRHNGSSNTVVTLLIDGGETKVTIDVPPDTTCVWSSQDGRVFAAGEQPAVQSSDVTGGSTYVSAGGVEV